MITYYLLAEFDGKQFVRDHIRRANDAHAPHEPERLQALCHRSFEVCPQGPFSKEAIVRADARSAWKHCSDCFNILQRHG